MKKTSLLFLCILFTALLLTFAVCAKEQTVFIKDGGDGNGFSPERALDSLEEAFEFLGDDGGTVVLCGKTTVDAAITKLKAWDKLVTLTMVYDGVDYRLEGAELYYTDQHRLFFAGPAKIENFTFNIAQTALIAAQWNPLEMGEGIEVKQHTSGAGIYLIGGSQNAAEGEFAFRDISPSLVIRSGKYHAVSPFGRQIKDTFVGSGEVSVYGGEISYLQGGPLNYGILKGDSVINVYGGKIKNLCLFTDASNTTQELAGMGKYTANVYGGNIEKIHVDANNSTAKFFLNCLEDAQPNLALYAEGENIANLTVTDKTKQGATETVDPSSSDNVVFVKDGANGDGTSPEKALGVLEDAFVKLGNTGGTIVICGRATLHAALTNLKPWNKTVVLTMVYGGTDYRLKGAELYYTGQHRLFFAGPAKVENFTFNIAQTAVIAAQWNPLEMGDGIIVKQHTSGAGIYLIGGSQDGAEGDFAFRNRAPHIVVRSGKYHAVSPYSRQVKGTFTASGSVDVYGGEINYLQGGPLNFGILAADSTINIYGGKINNLCLFTDPGNTTTLLQGEGKYVANIYGGEISKIICDANNTAAKFYVNCSSGAQSNIKDIIEGEGMANLTVADLDKPLVTEIKLTIGSSVGYVNGEAKTLDAAPIIRNSRTMLPVRFVAENLGATVKWDGATSTATLILGDTTVEIVIGSLVARVNGVETSLDTPAFIENSRTYLPVRFVAEGLGATVAWDGATSTATLTAERTSLGEPDEGITVPPATGG